METMFQTNKSYKQPTETMVHPSLGEIKIEWKEVREERMNKKWIDF